jgi:hypothetical protein
MEIKEVIVHSIENSKYKVQFEQAATKGIIGFKVEANDDDIEKCKDQASSLLQYALKRSSLSLQPVPSSPNNGSNPALGSEHPVEIPL